MKFVPLTPTVIYTAKKDETVTLKMWNKTSGMVPGMTVVCGGKFYNNNDMMAESSPNEQPDTAHVIAMKKGDEIVASCEIENAFAYEVE